FSASFGYNPDSHFNNEYLDYKGGKTDFLGFDDGTRAIPAVEDIPQYAQVVGNPDGELGMRYKEILNSFNPTMAAMQQMSFADFSLSASYGNQVPKEGYTLGYNAAFSYKNSTDFYQNAEYGRYGLGSSDSYEMERREYQTGSYGENSVLLSGMAGFAIKTNSSKMRVNVLHLQHGESKAGVFDFIGSDQGSDFKAFQHGLDYSQKSLTHLLLDGKHSIKDNEWNIVWKFGTTYSNLSDPDVRFTRYEVNDNNTVKIGTEVGFPERIWRSLNEINNTASIHVTKAFKFRENASKVHFGALNTYKYRTYIIRNFAINPRGGFALSGDPNELFSEENLWLKDGQVGLGTTYETPFIPTNPNQFIASSINSAAFVSTELSLLANFKAIVGLRLENFMQYYTGSDQQRNNVLDNEKVLSDIKLFPTVNLLYQVTGNQNIRASYTQTIARPSFKELSYAEIYDPISGIIFIGGFHKDGDDIAGVEYWDGNLVSTDIRNYDLRWEIFGKYGQTLSAGVFYKAFANPIEIVQYTKQVGAFQPRNVGDGTSYGAELEFRKNLDFLSDALSSVKVNANVTLNRSSIEMSEMEYDSRIDNARLGETVDRYRAMAGQAPYLVNSGLSYTGGKNGFWQRLEAGLYYNVQGPTLEYVGVADRPDIYTKTFNSLDFNSSYAFGSNDNMQIGFKVNNLLNEAYEMVYVSYRAQEQYFERRNPGMTFTAKFSYKF
ncbi:MAG: TonB-dependent receptor, partial [Bacteroidales bacterium]|nr:TonB-dependent receptor [Bacteroidales bacterium]